MSPTLRASSLRTFLFSLLAFTAGGVLAQTSINEVHVAPREKNVSSASVVYTASTEGAYGEGSLIRTGVDLVLVPVTITDDLNRPVVGLDRGNFQLFENKKRQEIKNFSSEDTPVSVGILMDTSASMATKLDRAREAVTQFCEAANPQDEFFLITFADTPQLASDFTTSPENIENDLLTAYPKGETALLDAIYMGLRKMRGARYGRRALLIISDGGDNHSRYTEREVKSAIRESDVMIYAVGTYERNVSTQEEQLGPYLLSQVSEITGGQAFTLTNAREMPAVTRNIGARLRHQYVLAYQPQTAPHDGKWHKLSVKLRVPKNLPFFHVSNRAGYYAGNQ